MKLKIYHRGLEKKGLVFEELDMLSEGTHIGSVRLFPMLHLFFLSGICNLCRGGCKEKPES